MNSSMGRVLVVDDDDDIRKLASGLFMEYTVSAVPTLKDAVKELDRDLDESPHLVLLDVMLRGEDGRDLLNHDRILTGLTQAILGTGIALPDDEVTSYAYRGIPVVSKPFVMSRLLAHVWAGVNHAKERRVIGEVADILGNISSGRQVKEELKKIQDVFRRPSVRVRKAE